MTRNHAIPVVGRHVEDLFAADRRPGDFKFWTNAEDGVVGGCHYLCPCGCGDIAGVTFPRWTWDGSQERPTVTPSIRRVGGCRWHGHLTAGVFEPCGDSGR